MHPFWKYRVFPTLMVLISLVLYIIFGYDLERTQFLKLISIYGSLFLLFYWILRLQKGEITFLVVTALLFRLIFLFTVPDLSQDFYRFIWDGRMLFAGYNPYLYLPEDIMATGNLSIPQAQELFEGMGSLSASHYTNYPPVNQFCFWLAAVFSGNSIPGAIVTMRILIILADAGTLFFGYKLLQNLRLPVHYIFIYILNPFILIELTGNLHFEGVMIFFLVTALYLLQKRKWVLSACTLALSISVKLLPLMLLPLFLQVLGWRKALAYYTVTIGVVIISFLPFFSHTFIDSYSETIALWFNNFEFNASIYYVLREIGFQWKGYNMIQVIGKITSGVLLLTIVGMALFRNNKSMDSLIKSMLIASTLYFFTASVVHPWYLATPLVLSIFTKYRFTVWWTLLVPLSYFAYSQPDFKESYLLLSIEYIVIYVLFLYEMFKKPQEKLLF
ncbi:glycosyltransferase 87 family protein [Ascidiimonas aurantiaca]|uniref:glycosyltransferase 87 family protein n=1 Tax=Ascidiimonas aurantiaca TaxID=1685432 RepID=UPI0030EC5439